MHWSYHRPVVQPADPTLPDRAALNAEIEQLERDADNSGFVQSERNVGWRRASTTLNVLTALLAGVAGVSTLAKFAGSVTPGVLALVAAGFASATTALDAGKRATAAAEARSAYIELRDSLRQLRNLDLPSSPPAQVRQDLKELCKRSHEVNKRAEVPGRTVQRKLRRRVERATNEGIRGAH